MIRPYYHRPYLLRLYQQGEIGLIVQYLTAGFIVTCVDYGSFILFFNILNMGLLVATVVGYVGGLFISYVLNRYWVFKNNAGEQSTKSAVVRYGILLFINLLITYGMLWAMEMWFGITPLIGKFVVGFFMVFWIYIADKYWVFKAPLVLGHKPTIQRW